MQQPHPGTHAFDAFVGQDQIKTNLETFTTAALARKDVVDHLLFAGPPGLGKTLAARMVAQVMGGRLRQTSGPQLTKRADLMGVLTSLRPNDVLFIDEIHRMPTALEEHLYPAMSEYKYDLIVPPAKGSSRPTKTLTLPLARFTLIGATTREGSLSEPLRSRFGYTARFDFYSPDDLALIVAQSAALLTPPVKLAPGTAEAIGIRARGTPRTAINLLQRCRDFAPDPSAPVTPDIAAVAFDALGVNANGLDARDRRYLDIVAAGPVGLDAIAAQLNETAATIEDAIEPYLLAQGYVQRTPRGRVATPAPAAPAPALQATP